MIGPEGGPVDGELAARTRSAAGGRVIEAPLRTRMEAAFGVGFEDVRIHTDSALAPEVGAVAFTSGRDVDFAPGTYAPETSSGLRTLAHELAHVVQAGGAMRRLEIEDGDTNEHTGKVSKIRRAEDSVIRRSVYLANEDETIYKDNDDDTLELACIRKQGNDYLSSSTTSRSIGFAPRSSRWRRAPASRRRGPSRPAPVSTSSRPRPS